MAGNVRPGEADHQTFSGLSTNPVFTIDAVHAKAQLFVWIQRELSYFVRSSERLARERTLPSIGFSNTTKSGPVFREMKVATLKHDLRIHPQNPTILAFQTFPQVPRP